MIREDKGITDEFYRAMLANPKPDYPVVSQPGNGVLAIRLAVTDVYARKKKARPAGLHAN